MCVDKNFNCDMIENYYKKMSTAVGKRCKCLTVALKSKDILIPAYSY